MQDVLEQLKAGIRRFQTTVYPEQAEMYRKAVSVPQEPHTLFIACADSRIDPELITQSKPGELFVLRNIGNLIPAYGEMMGGVSAVVEYAVSLLKVKHVVVCGHADCGAMKGLLAPDSVTAMPAVKNWLKNAATAMSVAEALGAENEAPATLMRRVTEQNVLLQIQHLRTHPSVAAAMARGELTVSAWVYEIGTGEVRISQNGSNEFVPVA
jgi:carbonic anhydrase